MHVSVSSTVGIYEMSTNRNLHLDADVNSLYKKNQIVLRQ